MKRELKLGIVVTSCVLLTMSCRKEMGDKLPPLTFEGKNTFGCKIDGTSWIPKGFYSFAYIDFQPAAGIFRSILCP